MTQLSSILAKIQSADSNMSIDSLYQLMREVDRVGSTKTVYTKDTLPSPHPSFIGTAIMTQDSGMYVFNDSSTWQLIDSNSIPGFYVPPWIPKSSSPISSSWTTPSVFGWSYDFIELDLTGFMGTSRSVRWNADGSKMYVLDRVDRNIYQYSLSTAWDLSTASYDTILFYVGAQESGPTGFFFTPDGTRMIIIGFGYDGVTQYNLSTAFDITTATYDTQVKVSGQEPSARGMTLSGDGTKLFVTGATQKVFRYSLPTPYDITGMTYDNMELDVSYFRNVPTAVEFNPDGTQMFICMDINELYDKTKLFLYDLSVAYDITTASFNSSLDDSVDASTYTGRMHGVSFNYDGTKAYLVTEGGDNIYQYSTGLSVSSITRNLIHTLENPNPFGTGSNDRYSWNLAVSGKYTLVSAYFEDQSASEDRGGKVYVYDTASGALLRTISNPNPYGTPFADVFGGEYSGIAISGFFAIIGAYGEDYSGGVSTGKAYIYNVSTGSLIHTLDNPNDYGTEDGDRFGQAVDISGDRAIVGAYDEDDAGGTGSGKAYIFDVSSGALLHTLDNPDADGSAASDNFGRDAVAISGNYAIVGGYGEGLGGRAYIFNATDGTLAHTLENPNPYGTEDNDYFGRSVDISGGYAIVGAYAEDDAGGTSSGKAYIFDVASGALLHTLDNPNDYGTSADDRFGAMVAISGVLAIVGAAGEGDAGGTSSGKAYIFNVITGALLDTLDNPNDYGTSASDLFGATVAISNNNILVAARFEDNATETSVGRAYLYNYTVG